ncbi:MAG: hypothetical protein UT36_C0009G0037 [Candidatus Peregrinibacteria bacterium GW2011_GWF2_39_17]|nr:MAG: hypothetical protein UT36_C0009G0037 [Candidatus Peregrinibacteria bacterium GW2011_GWF2_39_17]
MMDYNIMSGVNGSGMMFFGWITYVLIVTFLVLGIGAFWKYINKK